MINQHSFEPKRASELEITETLPSVQLIIYICMDEAKFHVQTRLSGHKFPQAQLGDILRAW